MAGVAITRTDSTALQLRAEAARTKDARRTRGRRGGCRRSRWWLREQIARLRPGTAEWIARPCATGCIATMPRDWPGLRAAAGRAVHGSSRQSRRQSLPVGSRPAPTWARDGVVRWRRKDPCHAGSRQPSASPCTSVRSAPSASPCTSVRSASNWRHSAFAGCRCARSTRSQTRWHRTLLKRLSDSGSGGDPGARAGQADRDMVPG